MNKILLSLFITLSVNANELKVAMIDTGINLDEVEQTRLVYSNYNKCLYNFNIETNTSCITNDYDNHGTIVYQILSKNMDKNSVLSYIYADPNGLMKEIDKIKYPSSLKEVYIKKQLLGKMVDQIADSIDLAIKNNARIINISLAQRGISSVKLEQVIKNNPNVLFVFGAGNSGDNLDIEYNKTFPCSLKFENTLCVGSLKNNKIAEYSNTGKDVDVYVHPELDEGTSFSTPVITKVAYTLLKKGLSVNLTKDIIKTRYQKK